MYMIKKIYDATEANTNFFPCHKEYLNTKNGVYCIEDTAEIKSLRVYSVDEATRYGKDEAYKTKNAKAYNSAVECAESETRYGFWNVKVEWVEF